MSLRAFVYLLILFLPSVAHAQTAVITGTVTQGNVNEPLPGANIFLKNTTLGAASGANGAFHLHGVPAGSYTLSVSCIGFATNNLGITVAAGDTLHLDLVLTEKPIEISEIIIERVMMTGGQSGILDIPGSAHYINARDLDRFSYNDINRVLRQVPGVNIQEEDGYGLRPNIGMRGTGVERSAKITLMEDGVLMAPAPYAAPAAYYFPTVGRMQGVEVRKGSSQIKFGPYTTGGALNLISTQIPDRFTGYAEILAGSNEDRTLHAHVGDSYDQVGFLVETFQTRTSGFKNLEFGGDTGFDKKDYLVKLRLNTRPTTPVYQALTLKASQTSETSHETYLGLTDADFEVTPYLRYAGSQKDVMNAEQHHYIGRYVVRPNDMIDITTTAYRTEFGRNWYKLDRVKASEEGNRVSIGDILEDPTTYSDEYAILRGSNLTEDNTLEVKNNNRNYYAQGVQILAGFTFPGRGNFHELEVGVRFHVDEVDRFQWIDLYRMNTPEGNQRGIMQLTTAGIPGTDSNRITRAKALASHAQYRLSAGNWTITPGLRYEHIELSRKDYGREDPDRTGLDLLLQENKVDVVIPGIGIDYRYSVHLSLFGGVHKGFAPPGPTDGARAEESVNYEAGLRYRERNVQVQSTFFFSDYGNLLGSDLAAAGADAASDPFNGGQVHAYGVELSFHSNPGLAYNIPFSIPIQMNYTFSQAVFQNTFESDFEPWGTVDNGDRLPYLPRHQLAAVVGIEIDPVALNLNMRYVDRMRTKAGQGSIIASESTDAQFIIDLSSTIRLSPHVALFASIRNLTNQAGIVARRPAGVRPGLPRLFLLGMKARF